MAVRKAKKKAKPKPKPKAPALADYAHVEIQTFNVEDLEEAPYNPRTISQSALQGLVRSIEDFGLLALPIVNVRDGKNRIVGGHQRIRSLKKTGVESVECIVVDFDETTEKQANFTLNNEAIQGRFLPELTRSLLLELDARVPGNSAALTPLRLDKLLRRVTKEMRSIPGHDDQILPGKTEDDDEIAPVKKPVSKIGARYQLGDHLLICGVPDWGGKISDMPFNYADMAFTLMSGVDYSEAEARVGLLFRVVAGSVYAATDTWTLPRVHHQFAVQGHVSTLLLWHNPLEKPSKTEAYRDVCFPVVYGWGNSATRYYCGARNKGSTPRLSASLSSQLPVEIPVDAMLSSSKRGNTVFDPCVGLGASVIAAEKTGRRLIGYVHTPGEMDAVRTRWTAFVKGGRTAFAKHTPEVD